MMFVFYYPYYCLYIFEYSHRFVLYLSLAFYLILIFFFFNVAFSNIVGIRLKSCFLIFCQEDLLPQQKAWWDTSSSLLVKHVVKCLTVFMVEIPSTVLTGVMSYASQYLDLEFSYFYQSTIFDHSFTLSAIFLQSVLLRFIQIHFNLLASTSLNRSLGLSTFLQFRTPYNRLHVRSIACE